MSQDQITSMVIFGASGDLTQRKLIPSLFNLHRKGRLPTAFRIIGHSKTAYNDQQFREHLEQGTQEHAAFRYTKSEWASFSHLITYHQGDYSNPEEFRSIDQLLSQGHGGADNRLYYMATPPSVFPRIVELLAESNQVNEQNGWRRVIIEKPFGTDLASARQLNAQIHSALRERQIYRIDHYLGKETVQNILVTRFANAIFEPLWNRNYIDHIQITVAEDVGLEHRAGYYDGVGVLRDVFQNHLLQLLSLVAMEPPASADATSLRNEKVKVLTSIQPLDAKGIIRDTVRAQYRGYRGEDGTRNDSKTATFAAVRFEIENWRWQGVPFYLRSGKRMQEKVSQVAIEFRKPPHNLFPRVQGGMRPNLLTLYLQPDEGIHWRFEAKVPDTAADMRAVDMEFHYADSFEGTEIPEAYERLLLDAIAGDASLFTRADEVEAAWALIDPILKSWETDDKPPLMTYEPGSWGPAEADALLGRNGRTWINAIAHGGTA